MFEDEVYDCIRQYDLSANIVRDSSDSELPGKTICIPEKNIVFHLIPIPFSGMCSIEPDLFQKKSLEYVSRSVPLIHLWQDQWIRKQEIIRSRIAALLGFGTHVHARQTIVRRIDKNDMSRFFDANHLQGSVNARYAYGLYADDRLVAAASFSSGRAVVRDGIAGRSFELLRYANLLEHRVVGGTGKLIAAFIRERHPDDMMTYADLDWASGKGYRALHFRQIAVTPPQMFWIHPDEMIRYYPHRLPSELTESFDRQNGGELSDDSLFRSGYVKIYNAGNLKYLLML